MGIAVYTVGGCFAEEVADSTMSHILNLYRRTSHVAEQVKNGYLHFFHNLSYDSENYFRKETSKRRTSQRGC